MSDLAGAIARRTQAIASPRALAYVESNRVYRISLVRPVTEPDFDRATGTMITVAGQVILPDQPARITTVRPGQVMDLGDAPSYWGAVSVTIGPIQLDPRIDDVVEILDNDVAEAAKLTGRQFRVVDITLGGQLPVGYTLGCVGVTASRWTTDPDPDDG